MYAVYACSSCGHTDYAEGPSATSKLVCSLCGKSLSDLEIKATVSSDDEAIAKVSVLVHQRLQTRRQVRPKRGLGVKRRVLDIVQSLIEMNRGRSVSVQDVISESRSAGIDPERAQVFLDRLTEEGVVTVRDDRVVLSGVMDEE